MSATGIGLSATAAPLARAKFQIRRLAASSRIRTLWATISSCRSPAIEQRVQGDQGLPLALEDVEDADLERLDHGGGRSHWIGGRAVGELDLDLERVGPGGGHHDVVGPDQVADPLVLDLGVDLVAVGVGVAVDLVEDEDDRLLGLAELGQGLDLDALHVAGDDEEDQVGVPGDVAGQGLADLAADLVDPRRVDQDELGLLEPRAGRRSPAPSAGRPAATVVPWVAPTLKTSWPSRAFRTDDLPRLTMPNAAISMVFSSSFWVRSRSCRSSSARARSSSGVSLRPARVSSRLSRARPTRASDVVQLVEDGRQRRASAMVVVERFAGRHGRRPDRSGPLGG